MSQSTGTYEGKSHSLSHDYNVLDHIFKIVQSCNNNEPYTVRCSCVNLSVSDDNTQSTGTQSSTSNLSTVETNVSTSETEASVTVEDENTNEENL